MFLIFSPLYKILRYRRQWFIPDYKKTAMHIHALNSVRREYKVTITIVVTTAVIKPNTTH